MVISYLLDKVVNIGEKDCSILPRLLDGTRYMSVFPQKLFSIVEVNCRFIDIHPCLGSILNAFHNKLY
jgi:hypothetical protein